MRKPGANIEPACGWTTRGGERVWHEFASGANGEPRKIELFFPVAPPKPTSPRNLSLPSRIEAARKAGLEVVKIEADGSLVLKPVGSAKGRI